MVKETSDSSLFGSNGSLGSSNLFLGATSTVSTVTVETKLGFDGRGKFFLRDGRRIRFRFRTGYRISLHLRRECLWRQGAEGIIIIEIGNGHRAPALKPASFNAFATTIRSVSCRDWRT
jgi:hypothetical protein